MTQLVSKSKRAKFGQIPEGWILSSIHELREQEFIYEIQDGNHGELYPRKQDFSDNGRLFLTANSITDDGRVDTRKTLRLPETHCKKLRIGFAKPGDVLFTHNATVGRVAILPPEIGECVVGTSVTYYRLNATKINREYFAYALQSPFFKTQLNQTMFQTTRSQVPITTQAKLSLIIPPLGQQEKIAFIISKLDELIEKTNQIIEQTQRLKKGLMLRLLTRGIGHTKFKTTEIGEIPVDWKILRLEELCNIERGKFTHRPRGDPDFYDGKYPFIQTGDVEKSDGYIRTFTQTLNQKGLSVSKLFPEGVIAITIAANIGSVAITTFPVCFPDSVVGITSKIMDTKFLAIYLQTRKSFLKGKATVNAQANINLETLKPLLTPVPSLSEQKKIASIVSSIESKVQLHKSLKDKIRSLKAGLMQQILTGKIRVKT